MRSSPLTLVNPAENRAGSISQPASDTTVDSREKLLEAALRLFASSGVASVSVRDIAREAGVNSALVGYYFRSKEGLLCQLYRCHSEPLNAERVRLLESFSRGSAVPSIEKVLEAFIRPSLTLATNQEGSAEFTRLRALLAAENSSLLEALVAESFNRSSGIFVKALHRSLPHLSYEDVLWRFHFTLGAINYTATGPNRIAIFSDGKCNPLRVEETLRELIPFLAAGFRFPRIAKRRSGATKSRIPAAPC